MGVRSHTAIGIFGMLALVAAGCSSIPAAGAAGSGSSAVLTASTSKAPIVIGTLVEATGALAGDSGIQAKLVDKAWLAQINAHGGINGHPVKLVIDDDNGSAAVASQDVESMVQQDHVIALVGVQSPEIPYLSYLEQQNVPALGGTLVTGSYVPYTNFYTAGATAPLITDPINFASLKAVHAKSFGVMACAESPACADAAIPLKTAAPKAGYKYVGVETVSASAPNYSAQCLAFKSAGAQAVVLFTAGAESARVATDCAAQGYDPHYILPDFDHTVPTVKGFEGVLSATLTVPWFFDSTPAEKAFQKVIRPKVTSTSSTSVDYGPTSMLTWAAFELFQTAATAATSKGATLTSASLVAAIKALTPSETTLGGLVGTTNYNASSSTQQNGCFWILELKSHKWTAPSTKPTCASSS